MVEQLVWRDSGRKRGYGYIHMESEEAVEAVVGAGIHTVAGVRLQAKRDNVRHAPLLYNYFTGNYCSPVRAGRDGAGAPSGRGWSPWTGTTSLCGGS